MSYCRWAENCNIYLILTGEGLQCTGCCRYRDLIDNAPEWGGSFVTKTRSEMIRHLNYHKRCGDKFPSYVIEDLKREIEESGDDPADDDEDYIGAG